MPRSHACATRLLNPFCPSSYCTCPLLLPVPKASRVTLMFDLPSVTRSVALGLAACSGNEPTLATAAPAAMLVFKNSRREGLTGTSRAAHKQRPDAGMVA